MLTSNSSITFTRVDFIQNTVQGDGGAILISDIAVDVELGAAVKFVGNDARGGNGGAIAIESGARLSAFGTIFEKNRGSMGGAVSLKVWIPPSSSMLEETGIVFHSKNTPHILL